MLRDGVPNWHGRQSGGAPANLSCAAGPRLTALPSPTVTPEATMTSSSRASSRTVQEAVREARAALSHVDAMLATIGGGGRRSVTGITPVPAELHQAEQSLQAALDALHQLIAMGGMAPSDMPATPVPAGPPVDVSMFTATPGSPYGGGPVVDPRFGTVTAALGAA
jgi:hypothetical protein